MTFSSPAFSNDEPIPTAYTCEGEGYSPPFNISEVPYGTKSLVLIMEDPDATGGTFDHWLIWNIDPDTETIIENTIPKNTVEGQNSTGKTGYQPPCPPAGSGLHHYRFRLSALADNLNIMPGSSKDELVAAVRNMKILAQTELVGTYTADENSTKAYI